MTLTSQWPLSSDGIRFLSPEFIASYLRDNPLTRDCYPLAMGYYPRALGHRMERSQHRDHLLIYCTAGEGVVAAHKSRYPIVAGDLVIIPRETAHSYYSLADQPWSIYWVHFAGEHTDLLIEPLLSPANRTQEKLAHIPFGVNGKLIADIENLLEVRQTGYNKRNFIHASSLLRQILSYLNAITPQQSSRSGAEFDLDSVNALMQENIHGQLSLEEMAASVNLSKYHFSNKYKKLTGQTPIQHFLHLKMEHACYLLDISGNSIKAISHNLGYEDSYYFSRLFKKIIGISPKQYRQLKRG